MNDEPLAYFLTWTIYGSHLQGHLDGWRRRGDGWLSMQPILADWRDERLIHTIQVLDAAQRKTVADEINRFCEFRNWRLWAQNVRSTHVHVVVHATNYSGSKVRDQLKANCTRVLREQWDEFAHRPVWARSGDWQCINELDDLETVIEYVLHTQDRKSVE